MVEHRIQQVVEQNLTVKWGSRDSELQPEPEPERSGFRLKFSFSGSAVYWDSSGKRLLWVSWCSWECLGLLFLLKARPGWAYTPMERDGLLVADLSSGRF